MIKKDILFLYSDSEFKEYIKKKNKKIFQKSIFIKRNLFDKKDFEKYRNIKKISIFVDTILDEKILKNFKKLRIIITRSIGTDHIDKKYCKSNKIKILSVPEYGSRTVAEFALTGLLYLLKNFDDYKSIEFNRGNDLSKKTIGVLGAGKIGQNFIRFCKAFDCNILVCDSCVNSEAIKKMGGQKVTFDKMLRNSDIISLHIPLCEVTDNIISYEDFIKMKDGVFLLNTARGGLINTKALYKNIKSGKVKKAHLDVLEFEHDLKLKSTKDLNKKRKEILMLNKKVIRSKNVLYTKHQAYNTREAVERIWKKTIEYLK